jgi:hypothetical protein
MHAHLADTAASHRIEVHRARSDDVGSRHRTPTNQLVLEFIDDFCIPLDGESGRSASDPVRLAVRRFRDTVEVGHELREIAKPTPIPIDVVYRAFQSDRLPHMNAAHT